jgi:Transcriptional regulator
LHLPVGSTVPAHCSASGKLLSANRAGGERGAMLATLPLPPFTANTITDHGLMARELDRILGCGYSLDNEEYVAGVACVAVPVRVDGEVIAAVAVHAAVARLPLQRAIDFVPRLTDAAAKIAKTFG